MNAKKGCKLRWNGEPARKLDLGQGDRLPAIFNLPDLQHPTKLFKDEASATTAEYNEHEAAGTLDQRQGDCLAANLGLSDQQHAAAPQ